MSHKQNKSKQMMFQKVPMPYVMLGIYVIFVIAVLLLTTQVITNSVSLVAACVFVILEVLLAVCLNRIPIWVHGLIIIGQIVAGLGFHALAFMILMAGVYFAAILLLYFWTKDN